jgi:uncharacterized protein (TIGR02588 family)
MPREKKSQDVGAHRPDGLELAATWISAVVIAALLAFLGWDAAQPVRPPEFRTEVEAPRAQAEFLYVPVTVHNLGDEAARMVHIRVASPTDTIEGEFTIEWLPGRSARKGVAIVRGGIKGPLRATVHGYSEP